MSRYYQWNEMGSQPNSDRTATEPDIKGKWDATLTTDGTLSLHAQTGNKKWIAKVTGTDPKYGYDRDFVAHTDTEWLSTLRKGPCECPECGETIGTFHFIGDAYRGNDGARDDEKDRPDELPYNHHYAAAFGPSETHELQSND